MEHKNYNARDIAHEIYAVRNAERKARGLPIKPWDKLDPKTEQFWTELVDLVVKRLPEPKREEDDGL